MIRQELYHAAKKELEHRRSQSQVQAQERREAAYTTLPELMQLDEQQAQAGAAAANFAMAGDKARSRTCKNLMNDVAVRRKEMLIKAGFAPNEWDVRPVCALCNDTGVYNNGTCTCLMEIVKRLRRENIHKLGALSLSSFETFMLDKYPEEGEALGISPRVTMGEILRDCTEYARDFGGGSPSLFLYGDAGLGKTHLALAVASEVLEKGYDVVYVSAQRAFDTISDARFGDDGGIFNSMLYADLLILDDLGTEVTSAYVLSKLYELVNGRMSRKPTIYTSNICSQELLHQRYTEKIASRLLGGCHLMRLWGDDIRLQDGM